MKITMNSIAILLGYSVFVLTIKIKMTTKLRFVEGACTAFNCTPSVVLAAVTGRFSVHPEASKQIKDLADKGCNATTKEWEEFVDAIEASPIADKMLWAMVTGAEIKLTE